MSKNFMFSAFFETAKNTFSLPEKIVNFKNLKKQLNPMAEKNCKI